MAKQLHRSFRDQQVRSLFQSYIDQEIELRYILDILKIGRSRFFVLLKESRKDPFDFSIAYSTPITTAISGICFGRSIGEKVSVPTIIKRAKEHDFSRKLLYAELVRRDQLEPHLCPGKRGFRL